MPMTEKLTPGSKASADLLKIAQEMHPDKGFIIIALAESKHPDNGTPQTDVGVSSDLENREEVLFWLRDTADLMRRKTMKKLIDAFQLTVFILAQISVGIIIGLLAAAVVKSLFVL